MAKTHFLNVDLEVHADRRLGPLVKALERAGALTLHHGPWRTGGYFATFEVGGLTTSADRTIVALASLVRGLPPGARAQWDGARRRVFDVGVEAANHSRPLALALRPSTLRQVTELGAVLAFTVYAPTDE